MAPVDCFVSVVVPLHDCGPIVPEFIAEVMAVLQGHYTNYELVLVDDGSKDDTARRVAQELSQYPCVRYIRLSRRFGAEIAIASGLDTVIGDFTVVMMPECDPPGLIPAMVAQARAGASVVFGVRKDRSGEPFWMRIGASLFYGAGKHLFQGGLEPNSTQFRVLNRQAVNAVIRIKEKYRYLRLQSFYVGFSSQSFPYELVWRKGLGRKGRGFWESVELAIAMVVSYSTHPLRWISWLGLGASGLNLLYMGYVLGTYLLRDRVAEGWTTMSLQSSGMFFLLFLCLSVLCEYVGRILEESRERPLYHVLEERNSNVLVADERRTNIVKESIVAQERSHG
ncbi:Glycosyltransferase [Cystobacter fuscus DSM 2262]|uniref:Glycosyltransferase n=1 Tax=Cystobacter fuscus (strain ATCC 25194 / DSM 2262 / NBRC 100088 / M29) TaxID=1242864 RepID=S9P7G5_CYSF2|nr:glycosyltransferase family 2 protein [Cystobacter fuscus]EPX60395.1 Glycosyltransferase [Cystobacter fuscus DSM 2262]